jgi:hypothetical protein
VGAAVLECGPRACHEVFDSVRDEDFVAFHRRRDARSDVDSNTTDLVADRFAQTAPLDKGFGQTTLRSANLRRPTIVRYAS